MKDFEINRCCAEAMKLDPAVHAGISDNAWVSVEIQINGVWMPYDPLHDDAQAMALVKKFWLTIYGDPAEWYVESFDDSVSASGSDLNRAICKCVAKMHKAQA